MPAMTDAKSGLKKLMSGGGGGGSTFLKQNWDLFSRQRRRNLFVHYLNISDKRTNYNK